VIVAIDGPAGVGKSSAARGLARKLGYAFLDTGALYRAVAWKALREGIPLDRTGEILEMWKRTRVKLAGSGGEFRVFLDGSDVSGELRRPDVEEGVRNLARDPRIREAMVVLQRAFAKGRDIVAEGRDTGTVVFPRAEVKFYLDADLDVRARRRRLQRAGEGIDLTEGEVRKGIEDRDRSDMNRSVAPLKRAEDSIYLDTTRLDLSQVIQRMADGVEKRRAQGDA
jgi:cytidylate kinase